MCDVKYKAWSFSTEHGFKGTGGGRENLGDFLLNPRVHFVFLELIPQMLDNTCVLMIMSGIIWATSNVIDYRNINKAFFCFRDSS